MTLTTTAAAGVAAALVGRYTALGYETQTLRIVTNPFGEYLDCSSAESALAGLGALKAILDADDSGIRIRFVGRIDCALVTVAAVAVLLDNVFLRVVILIVQAFPWVHALLVVAIARAIAGALADIVALGKLWSLYDGSGQRHEQHKHPRLHV